MSGDHMGSDYQTESHVTGYSDWSNVNDPELLQKISFPLVSQSQLEYSLDQAATGS